MQSVWQTADYQALSSPGKFKFGLGKAGSMCDQCGKQLITKRYLVQVNLYSIWCRQRQKVLSNHCDKQLVTKCHLVQVNLNLVLAKKESFE